MPEGDYEYHGLVARSWDFLRGDTSKFPDRAFYRRIVEANGEPGLIVGCGTGRLLLEYVGGGLDVEGTDVSPEMLVICREKAKTEGLEVTLHQQAMEAMHLPRKYGTMIVPSSNFQLVTEPASAQTALESFLAHLLPGGTLVMSIWHMQGDSDGEWGDWWQVAEKTGFEGGKTLRRWERSRYDPETQLRHTENRYELLEDGEVITSETHRRSPEMRNYAFDQLAALLEKAGYRRVRGVKGFSDEPASEEDEVFCIIGMR